MAAPPRLLVLVFMQLKLVTVLLFKVQVLKSRWGGLVFFIFKIQFIHWLLESYLHCSNAGSFLRPVGFDFSPQLLNA